MLSETLLAGGRRQRWFAPLRCALCPEAPDAQVAHASGVTVSRSERNEPLSFLRAPAVPPRTVLGAHVAAVVLTVGVMWLLHAAEHGGLLIVALGAGVYVAVLGGTLSIATRRAQVRAQRQRENLGAYLAERDHHLRADEERS
jgi:hypothetical protein